MQISYYIETHYGNDHIYILEEDAKRAIAKLTGKKTVSEQDLENLTLLGVHSSQVLNPKFALA